MQFTSHDSRQLRLMIIMETKYFERLFTVTPLDMILLNNIFLKIVLVRFCSILRTFT